MIDREQVHLHEIARLDAERLRTRQEVERLRGERDAANRLYDLIGEELEQIIGGDGTTLERLRRLEAERDAYRAMLCDLLATAHPHPTMSKQWERARELLKNGPISIATEQATEESK